MELKQGYKQTEVGVIPEDWDVKTIGSVCKIFGRIGFRGYTVKDIVKEGKGAITLSPSNIEDNQTSFKTCTYISWAKYEESPEIKIYNDDVLLVKTGSTFGKTALVKNLNEPATLNPQIVVLKQIEIDNRLLSYLMSFDHIQDQIASFVVGGAIPTLSQNLVAKFTFPLPPTKDEQCAIATALNDVDALIQSQDALIAKKRDLKQAVMQQLLSGTQRLPKFSGEWKAQKLGDIVSFHKGKGLPKSEITSHGTERCIHYGELFTKYPETITQVESRTNFNVGVLRSVANDVLMPTSDVTPNGLAKASCVKQSGIILGGDILVIRPHPNLLNGSFLSYVIRWQRDQIMQLVSGSTVYHLYGSDMKNFSFLLPGIEEQNSIVQILSDMGAEIAALEAQRDKTRDLKQGMMQELLTGKTRLL